MKGNVGIFTFTIDNHHNGKRHTHQLHPCLIIKRENQKSKQITY
jgi:hypothetical protein